MKIITLVLGLSLFNQAFARPEKGFREKGERFSKELGLTDEQMKKVTEIRKNNSDKLQDDRKKFRELKKSFDEAMRNPQSSTADLKTKFEAFQKARDSFQRARFEKMLKMREILTAEQRVKFQELKKEHRPRENDRKMKRKG